MPWVLGRAAKRSRPMRIDRRASRDGLGRRDEEGTIVSLSRSSARLRQSGQYASDETTSPLANALRIGRGDDGHRAAGIGNHVGQAMIAITTRCSISVKPLPRLTPALSKRCPTPVQRPWYQVRGIRIADPLPQIIYRPEATSPGGLGARCVVTKRAITEMDERFLKL